MKKRLAVVLALVMILTLAIPLGAMAAVNTISLKVEGEATFETGSVTAYRVFDMTGNANDGFVYTIDPAFNAFRHNNLGGEALAVYIYTLTANHREDVIAADSPMRALTEDVMAFVRNPANTIPNPVTGITGEGSNTLLISVEKPGYYFVIGQVRDTETGSIAPYMALVSTDSTFGILEVNPKFELPTITKEVDNGGQGSIGDVMTFTLNGRVPMNIGAFDEYTYEVRDTMHNLTFVPNSVAITVGGSPYDGFTAVPDATGKELTIAFNSAAFLALNPGAPIVITYGATIDASAITLDPVSGEPFVDINNSVILEYSNDPRGDGTGEYEPEIPTPVFTFWFDFFKHTGAIADALPVDTVTFALSRTPGLQNAIRGGDLTGTMWFEKITPIPGTATADYAIYRLAEDQTGAVGTQVIETPANGRVRILGLGAGTYQLYEIATKAEFTLLPGPVVITIAQTTPGAGDFTVTGPSGAPGTINIQNNRASGFHETGGIGRTIFFVTGIMIMLGSAAILMARRKRASGASAK